MEHTDTHQNSQTKGILLPPPRARQQGFVSTQVFADKLIYCAACGSIVGEERICGKVGVELTMEQALQAARLCALQLLADLQEALGDLNRVKRLVRITGQVNCSDQFAFQAAVLEGSLEIFRTVLGERRAAPVCTASGANALPANAACQIDLLAEIF